MDYEHILLQKKGVKVYNIPPMTTSKGHYLDSWKNKITELNMKITAKGHKCTVFLINYDGSLFAAAPIPDNYEQAVVKCVDSSRGFALRVQDPSGRNAWLGIAFVEINDSFDFQAAFQDFEKNRDMELHPEKYAAENKPTHDFSLKKGEKITFNVGGAGGANKPKTGFSGDMRLAPPPGSNSFGLPPPSNDRPPQFTPVQTNTASTTNTSQGGFGNFDSFGSFGGFGSNQGSNQNNNFGGNQGGFGSWGGQTQQQTSGNNANNFDLLGDINFSGQPTTQSNVSSNQQSSQGAGGFDLL